MQRDEGAVIAWPSKRSSAPFLPTTRAEMDALGWDACDVIIVSGDAYIDHASFGAAVIGRVLEAAGYRVGILPQPDWQSAESFRDLGPPRLFFGITAGNMDSMVNRYTSDRRIRTDDAYSPNGEAGLRPDRAVIVYSQRCREAYHGVPVVIGGIEASLRRIAHWDYWSEKVRRSVLLDAKADLLLYGNAERAIVTLAQRLANGEPIRAIDNLRGTAVVRSHVPEGLQELDLSMLPDDETQDDERAKASMQLNPYESKLRDEVPDRVNLDAQTDGAPDAPARDEPPCATPRADASHEPATPLVQIRRPRKGPSTDARDGVFVRLPSFEQVQADPVLYAHASRLLHKESNPHNARMIVQRHGTRELWILPPPRPLETTEMDAVFDLPFRRVPHPRYGDANIPAYEMIKHSVIITRGCFGGCTFCSITEHEGRIIQNRSQGSVLREIGKIRDEVPGFRGVISDLGGPTANMYRLACKDPKIEAACRRPSCVYPGICENLQTDHTALIELYRAARAIPGVKKILIASGLRYDLAVRSPQYIKELATHHVGGYLKIAPEHVAEGPLSVMMKPGIGTYDRFKTLFDAASKAAGKKQYLIPYFIAAHPGTRDEDMLELAIWLKRNGFKADQVQAFLPSPMASATAMYYSGRNVLSPLRRFGGRAPVYVPRGMKQRRLHKAFLRWHDPENWPLLREALHRMGRSELIGFGEDALIPPAHADKATGRPSTSTGSRRRPTTGVAVSPARAGGRALTQHTGLPPRGPQRKDKRRQ